MKISPSVNDPWPPCCRCDQVEEQDHLNLAVERQPGQFSLVNEVFVELLPEDKKWIHDGFKCYEEGVDDPVHHPLDIPGMDFLWSIWLKSISRLLTPWRSWSWQPWSCSRRGRGWPRKASQMSRSAQTSGERFGTFQRNAEWVPCYPQNVSLESGWDEIGSPGELRYKQHLM